LKWGSGELLVFKINEVQAFYAKKLVTKRKEVNKGNNGI
jgi:hypothetical protein